MQNKISLLSKLLLIAAAIFLIASMFVPIWRIELSAPQYPEGLRLLIYSNDIGGDVDIINGLNHYIGMQTLKTENFIEFSILRYIIGTFALFSIVVAFTGSKKLLNILLTAFILFGIIAMVDFWRWEYNYGHNLDPKAAIIVPGMAYQPPLIGFKQLLNFGAYSIPDKGGWFFIASGLLMLCSTVFESKFFKRFNKGKTNAAMYLLIPFAFLLNSCSSGKPEPIVLNRDHCDFCKMTIADGRFGCELITAKGRFYKFDDLGCMLRYKEENHKKEYRAFFVNDYSMTNTLINAETALFIESAELKSPMGRNIAAFKEMEKASSFAEKYSVSFITWEKVDP